MYFSDEPQRNIKLWKPDPISLESLSEMNLKPGMPVWVCFKASDVILAVQG